MAEKVRMEKTYRFKVESIGFEIECGLDSIEKAEDLANSFNLRDFRIGSDSSVDVPNKTHDGREIKFWTPINELKNAENFVSEIFNAKLIEQNNTCGNHRHVRVLPTTSVFNWIIKLKNSMKSFREFYIEYFEENPKYIARLFNEYSKNVIEWPESREYFQLAEKYARRVVYPPHDKDYENEHFPKTYYEEDRYAMINPMSFHEHSTTEFRVFPYAESSEEFNRQTKSLIHFIEQFESPYRIYNVTYSNKIYITVAKVNRKYIAIDCYNKIIHRLYTANYPKLRLSSYINLMNTKEYGNFSVVKRDLDHSDWQKFVFGDHDVTGGYVIERNRLNYSIFRISDGTLLIPITELQGMTVNQFAELVKRELENWIDIVAERFGEIYVL